MTSFLLISQVEKDHSMIETHRLKNVVIFFQTILSFVLSRKIIFFNSFSYEFTIEFIILNCLV